MDLSLTEAQELLRGSARAFLERECPLDHVRAMEDDETGYSPALWARMASLGWHGLALDEDYGGTGFTVLELCLLAEEMGRVLLPGPFLASALCGQLIALAAVERQRERYLRALASGDAIHVPALLETGASWSPEAITMAAPVAGDGRLVGTKLFVLGANAAHFIHAWTTTGDGSFAVAIVPTGAAGIAITRLPTLACDHQFEVRFGDVRVAAEDIVIVDARQAHRWWALSTTIECAWLLGLSERSLEMTVTYATGREQFGRPIGSFQAVQHRAASMRIDVDGMRALTYRAAWALVSDDPAAERAVAEAKAFCSDASRRVAGNMQQVHGAIGFTREYPSQLYFRRQKRAELAWGDAAFHRERLAELWEPGLD